MKAALVFSVMLAVIPIAAHPADVNGDRHEIILFPLAFRSDIHMVRGAFGTVWTGEVWVDNRNSTGVVLSPPCEIPIVCPVEFIKARRAHMLTAPLGQPYRPEAGLLLYIPVEQAAGLTFSNRIFELTSRSQPRGVDLPVVREGEFFHGVKTFLAVPTGNDVRISLRIYDPWLQHVSFGIPAPTPLEAVRVQVVGPDESVVGSWLLTPQINPTGSIGDFLIPGFAAIYDLASVIPAVDSHPRIHLRVTPIPEDAQYWGMVSVTDNETQTVSIISAQ
jgi:hypothetical protein